MQKTLTLRIYSDIYSYTTPSGNTSPTTNTPSNNLTHYKHRDLIVFVCDLLSYMGVLFSRHNKIVLDGFVNLLLHSNYKAKPENETSAPKDNAENDKNTNSDSNNNNNASSSSDNANDSSAYVNTQSDASTNLNNEDKEAIQTNTTGGVETNGESQSAESGSDANNNKNTVMLRESTIIQEDTNKENNAYGIEAAQDQVLLSMESNSSNNDSNGDDSSNNNHGKREEHNCSANDIVNFMEEFPYLSIVILHAIANQLSGIAF